MTVSEAVSCSGVQRPLVMLLGQDALALADRLMASGYGTHAGADGTCGLPAAALVGADAIDRVAWLRDQFGSIPILIGVSDDTIEAREACFSCGADDFWFTTSGASDLLQRLRLHLAIQERSQMRRPLLTVGDLSVDISCRQVRRGQRPIALTAREYALLMLLMEERGTVVGRDRILREVWNDEQGSSSNVIEVYVRYLRQKLEEGGDSRLIHTIRGRGYCLNDGVPRPEPS